MMKKSDLVKAAKDYLDSVSLGLDPVSKDALPPDSVGMDRRVRDAAAFASVQLGYLLANKAGQNRKPGAVDALYDNLTVLESLGAGRDPVSGDAVAQDDPMGSSRVRRCMSFASETMGGIFDKARGRKKASFRLPSDVAATLEAGDGPMMASGIAKIINDRIPDPDRVNGVQAQTINDWLEQDGVLSPRAAKGAVRMPSDKGVAMGITVEDRVNGDGEPYRGVVYPPDAQRYVLAHVDDIARMARDQRLESEKAKAREEASARKEAAIRRQKGRSYGKQAEAVLGSVAEDAAPERDPSLDPWG